MISGFPQAAAAATAPKIQTATLRIQLFIDVTPLASKRGLLRPRPRSSIFPCPNDPRKSDRSVQDERSSRIELHHLLLPLLPLRALTRSPLSGTLGSRS